MIHGSGRELVLAVVRSAAHARGPADCVAWCETPDEGRAVLVGHVPEDALADAEARGYVRVVSRATPVVEMHVHGDGKLCPEFQLHWQGAVVRVTAAGKREARDEFVEDN